MKAINKKSLASALVAGILSGAVFTANAEDSKTSAPAATELKSTSTSTGHNTVTGDFSHVVGNDNDVQGDKHTVVGQSNIVTGEESVAIGYEAQATGIESTIAVGNNARATANQTTAIGVHTKATGEFSQAIGSYTVASGEKSVAIGDHSTAAGGNSISIGGSKAGAENNIAIGGSAVTDKMGSVAIGNNALATGDYSTALGIQSKALGGVSTAIGDGAKASESWTTALGGVAFATATNAVAVGGKSVASHANSVALGFKSETKDATPVNEATVGKLTYSGFAGNNPQSVVSVGTEGNERQIVNVAAGQINQTSTDAINGSQLYSVQDNLNNLGTSVTNVLGGDANLAANGTVTMTNIGGTGENTVDAAIKYVREHMPKVQAGDNVQVTESTEDNRVTYTISTKDYQPAIDENKEAIAANKKSIDTNAQGVAANAEKIKEVEAKLPEVQAGENTVVTSTTDANGKVTYTVSSKDFQPAIDAVDAKAEANKAAIAENTKGIEQNAKDIKAVEAKIPTVQAGENTTVDVAVDTNGKATYTVNAKDFQPAINAVDAKAEANTKSIEANKAAIAENAEGVKQNAEGVKANAAEIKEVAKEAKRHSVVKAGKNTTVTKSFGENGEAVYTVDANIETNHLATKAEVNKHIGEINDRIDGVEGKVAQNAKAIRKLDRDVRKNRKRADAGIAAVAAMANIPQVYLPGKSGVGIGVGHKHGQSALAIGYSRTSDNAHHIIKLSAGVDSQKDVTVGAGYMYQW